VLNAPGAPGYGVPETPCYVVDLGALRRNLATLARAEEESGAAILLALKGFAMWSVFPEVRRRLRGIAASGLHEAELGRREFGGEVHVYSPAYPPEDVPAILDIADHVVFNSFGEWRRHRDAALAASAAREAAGRSRLRFGMRVNPEHSEVKVTLYDPCAPRSRLGVTAAEFERAMAAGGGGLEGLSGLHFHTLCELDSDALERTVEVFERRFGAWIGGMQWINMGGGHHITRPGYDIERLARVVRDFRRRHDGVEVYLEPGEAIALRTGVLVASVLDIVENEMPIAILDTSATAHMPDVLEMPYRAEIEGAGQPGEFSHTYRLGGLTCLAGDIIGDYSFRAPLAVGQRLVFLDMAHYTMVKNTTFNGVRLPSIAWFDPETGETRVVRRFGYEDYRNRLS
jgi:carboxynorspermidine decarboxylase